MGELEHKHNQKLSYARKSTCSLSDINSRDLMSSDLHVVTKREKEGGNLQRSAFNTNKWPLLLFAWLLRRFMILFRLVAFLPERHLLLAPTGALVVMVCYCISAAATSHFFGFLLSPLMQLMLKESLKVALTVSMQFMSQESPNWPNSSNSSNSSIHPIHPIHPISPIHLIHPNLQIHINLPIRPIQQSVNRECLQRVTPESDTREHPWDPPWKHSWGHSENMSENMSERTHEKTHPP